MSLLLRLRAAARRRALTILFGMVKLGDPAYFKDFRTLPGYLGANPPPWLQADRVRHTTRVLRVVMSDQAAAAGLPAPEAGGPQVDADTAWRNMQRQMGGCADPQPGPRPGGGRLTAAKASTVRAGS